MRVILASKSPRRKELLKFILQDFEVVESKTNEKFDKNLTLEEQSKKLAYVKARKVFDETFSDRIVIGADTLVVKDGNVYGKPKDREDAILMLNKLKNGIHQVITSLAVLVEKDGKYDEYVLYDKTDIHVKDMSKEEIEKWVDLNKCYDKAGSYGIQSEFSVFIDRIEGNYFTVVGLPIHKLYDILKKYI